MRIFRGEDIGWAVLGRAVRKFGSEDICGAVLAGDEDIGYEAF